MVIARASYLLVENTVPFVDISDIAFVLVRSFSRKLALLVHTVKD